MPILASEIKWMKSLTVSDDSSNGGRLSKNEIPDGVKNNIFPDVPQAERTTGSTRYRKVFIKFANPDNLLAIAPKLFVETNTAAQDMVAIFPGSLTDTQATLTGSERLYGAARLQTAINAGSSVLEVNTEGASFNLFRNGDLIRISNKATVDDIAGFEEFATLAAAPSYSGDLAQLTLTSALANSFPATNTKVASCYQPGDLKASTTTPVLTSVAGTFNSALYPIIVDHIGGITQNWLLTFTSASSFNVTGDTLGSIGGGSISVNFTPLNSDFARPFFTLDFHAFGGTFVSGNTLSFTTQPAAIALWYKRVVPAGAASYSGNQVIIGVDCESA
ncbi:hypothetical protein [Iodobacter sp.]|uniref:hypothetical protein n=1 Tax=Iodobacter sp. TaxID=1915058 RepID=UPI0026006BA2|nr:hypothetical protein [Iodobacter sp.]